MPKQHSHAYTVKSGSISRQALWIAALAAALVIAAAILILTRSGRADGGEIALRDGKLTGIGDGWLVAGIQKDGETRYAKIGEVVAAKGYKRDGLASANSVSAEPEVYFVPESGESPVKFFFYTAGQGDPKALAETAKDAYMAFYEDYAATEISTGRVAEKDCRWFSYTCSYPNADKTQTVFEQSAVCYFPSEAEDAFAACIVSLNFDSASEYLSDEALMAYLETAGGALALEGAK